MFRSIAAKFALAGSAFATAAIPSTAALAHAGDHSHMTFAQIAEHLSNSIDHRLAIVGVGLVLAVIAAAWTLTLRPAKPGRSRGKREI